MAAVNYISRYFSSMLDRATTIHYVCFARKHQSGYELALKLGISTEELWKLNPHLRDIQDVWGGEVLLVPQHLLHRKGAWADVSGDFTLEPWRWRAEDFPTYPRKDEFIDGSWQPPMPAFKPITGTAAREGVWGKFQYVDASGDDIRITDGWEGKNIGTVQLEGLKGILIPAKTVVHSKGSMHFNKKCHKQLQGLWSDWVRYDLIRHILTFDGAFNPRYMRKASHTRDNLSNHAWGTAFDINYEWNKLGHTPAALGKKGSVLDMVEIAHRWGFYWGGHFGVKRADGMHFEVAKIL